MKKSSFVTLIMGTIGGFLSAIGLCMCLVSEWDAFAPGLIMGGIGLVVLLITLIVWRKMTNKAPVRMDGRTLRNAIVGVLGALLLGVGMCLAMVWGHLVVGIIVGIVGIVVLLSLISFIKGFR